MLSIPNSLCEAARIDGYSEIRIFFNIIVPPCKAGLATLTIFAFNASMDRGTRKNKIRAGLTGILDQTERFGRRSCFYMLQGQHILAPKLPETGTAGMRRMAGEFSAENCTLNSDVYNLLTKILKPARESEL
jgi:hypothetical protein